MYVYGCAICKCTLRNLHCLILYSIKIKTPILLGITYSTFPDKTGESIIHTTFNIITMFYVRVYDTS